MYLHPHDFEMTLWQYLTNANGRTKPRFQWW